MERRSYHQYCGVAKSLDVVGERWTMLIVRNLLLGPLRYSDLLRGLPGITTNLLAKRLREMEDAGIVERLRGPLPNGGHAYRLTTVGAKLEPVVHALGRWAWQWMGAPEPGELRNVEWLFVALRRRYRGGVRLRAELVVDEAPYRMILSTDGVEITRGEAAQPDVRIRATGAAVMRLFLDKVPQGRTLPGIAVDGSREAVRILSGAFHKHEP